VRARRAARPLRKRTRLTAPPPPNRAHACSAVAKGAAGLALWMAARGADKGSRDKGGRTPLDFAELAGNALTALVLRE
jgi:hypothetical protein